jgi:hypothetical protein
MVLFKHTALWPTGSGAMPGYSVVSLNIILYAEWQASLTYPITTYRVTA